MVSIDNMQLEEMISFLEKLLEVCESHEFSSTIAVRRRATILLKQLRSKETRRSKRHI